MFLMRNEFENLSAADLNNDGINTKDPVQN